MKYRNIFLDFSGNKIILKTKYNREVKFGMNINALSFVDGMNGYAFPIHFSEEVVDPKEVF